MLKGNAERCIACGAVMRGDIAHLSDRLAAEEQHQDAEDRTAT
jgi:DNA-directed RNA polymerase subunit N (RpoN/RPB10)